MYETKSLSSVFFGTNSGIVMYSGDSAFKVGFRHDVACLERRDRCWRLWAEMVKNEVCSPMILCRGACGMRWFGTVIWLSQRVRLEPLNTIICSARWCTSRSLTCSHLLAMDEVHSAIWWSYWEAFAKFNDRMSEAVERSRVA